MIAINTGIDKGGQSKGFERVLYIRLVSAILKRHVNYHYRDLLMNYTITINGQVHETDVDGNMPLLWFLRDTLELTGTKYGCGIGLCGSCTVHVDGNAMRSCLMTVKASNGKKVTTIEGLSKDGSHPLQIAWLSNNVSQCGYCQPGQIMTAADLLAKNSDPSMEEITTALEDNICRCGTYKRISLAVADAAKQMKGA